MVATIAALTLATPPGSLAGPAPSESETLLERLRNGDPPPWGAEGRFAELSFTAFVGTPFEFSVDWLDGSALIVPVSRTRVELADPDAGCAVTGTGFAGGWIVNPPGFGGLGECSQKVLHDWPIARNSLTCVVMRGECWMSAFGLSRGGRGFGNFFLSCYGGPGVVVAVWSQKDVYTMNCSAGVMGDSPDRWELWSGRVISWPSAATDSGLSLGLNWRFEP